MENLWPEICSLKAQQEHSKFVTLQTAILTITHKRTDLRTVLSLDADASDQAVMEALSGVVDACYEHPAVWEVFRPEGAMSAAEAVALAEAKEATKRAEAARVAALRSKPLPLSPLPGNQETPAHGGRAAAPAGKSAAHATGAAPAVLPQPPPPSKVRPLGAACVFVSLTAVSPRRRRCAAVPRIPQKNKMHTSRSRVQSLPLSESMAARAARSTANAASCAVAMSR